MCILLFSVLQILLCTSNSSVHLKFFCAPQILLCTSNSSLYLKFASPASSSLSELFCGLLSAFYFPPAAISNRHISEYCGEICECNLCKCYVINLCKCDVTNLCKCYEINLCKCYVINLCKCYVINLCKCYVINLGYVGNNERSLIFHLFFYDLKFYNFRSWI